MRWQNDVINTAEVYVVLSSAYLFVGCECVQCSGASYDSGERLLETRRFRYIMGGFPLGLYSAREYIFLS